MKLILGLYAGVMLWRYRDVIAEAIRRGPWGGGGGPSSVGPAPAADPFTHRFGKKLRGVE